MGGAARRPAGQVDPDALRGAPRRLSGRDQIVDQAELALAADGRFLALRWTGMHNAGAYIEGAGAIPIVFSLKLASTVYDIPAVAVTSQPRALPTRRRPCPIAAPAGPRPST